MGHVEYSTAQYTWQIWGKHLHHIAVASLKRSYIKPEADYFDIILMDTVVKIPLQSLISGTAAIVPKQANMNDAIL